FKFKVCYPKTPPKLNCYSTFNCAQRFEFLHAYFDVCSGTYIDKKCPFTGTVSIRGRILAGTCHSAKMMRTIIVRRNYLHYIKKYQRYEKRHSNIAAHVSPCFRVKEGDHVIIGQCRPLSKTVRFNVLKVIPAGSSGGGKKAFTGI
ncbi:40S ribosomal protein S11, partial [Linum perenne]